MEIAVYGKGGIGKSTISANLSAALAASGKRVLQIGCDPKHDSTRLLMHGRPLATILDYLRTVDPGQENPGAVLGRGCFDIGCIEAGGPEPGVGCAGRGILTSFEFIKRHRIKEGYDTIIYDVLGDVVCGGFAVPVRSEYADCIFLVTSGEYMAIYAANNILRGIRNFDGERRCRVAGIIFNERRVSDEAGRVRRFAKAVGLPVCARVPRSEAFARAEEENRPLMEMDGWETAKEVFSALAEKIHAGLDLYAARPLTDEQLEQVVLTSEKKTASFLCSREERDTLAKDTSFSFPSEKTPLAEREEGAEPRRRLRPPLYGCAFNGAITTAVHLTDAYVIAHGPRACAFYTMQNLSSPGRKNLFHRGILMPSAIHPHFASTDIGQSQAVYGGMELLRKAVEKAEKANPAAIIIVSSCVSGIMGDDIRALEEKERGGVIAECYEERKASHPEPLTNEADGMAVANSEEGKASHPEILTIAADGVIAGDYMEGIRLCLHTVADKLIDPSVRPEGRLVNIIGEVTVANNAPLNFRVIRDFLARMDIRVNCRFLGEASVEEVRNFLKAPINILASASDDVLALKDWLTERYGCRFLPAPFPVGFDHSATWVRQVGAAFDRQTTAEEIIEEQRESFRKEIAGLRPHLQGKTILLTTINVSLDWLIEAAQEAGMRFVWIGVLNYLRQSLWVTQDPAAQAVTEEIMDFSQITDKIRQTHPSLILTNYTSYTAEGDYIQDAIPMAPVAGFRSALYVLRRWAKLFETRKEGEWKNDRELFEACYA